MWQRKGGGGRGGEGRRRGHNPIYLDLTLDSGKLHDQMGGSNGCGCLVGTVI